jgi:ATP-dependent RNA helicase DeaD
MSEMLPLEAAPLGLDAVLRARGFERLTPIQSAVLDPALAGRDLRMSSQTGSGKTVAVGLVLAESVNAHERMAEARAARPTALVIAPTRELAAQVARELGWLFLAMRKRVVSVTGGASFDDELSRLRAQPAVVVGTPGRILDHLRRGTLSLEAIGSLVLDEADEMLDMGFEEELEGILGYAPAERRSHLVSATFGDRVARIADRLQQDPVWIHGTPLGAPNADIDHVAMLVEPKHRVDALVNLLLRNPDDKTLVFVKTRADAQDLGAFLSQNGFFARALSGDMTQRERNAAFGDFRSGVLRVLVATDVAARGLDVSDIARVVQLDAPESSDVLTHRGGRTGRAGKRGENILFVGPRSQRRAQDLFRQAGVSARVASPPTAEEIRRAADDRLRERVKNAGESAAELRELAHELLGENDAEHVVAHLLSQLAHTGSCAPRDIAPIEHRPSAPKKASGKTNGEPRRTGVGFVKFQVSWGARYGADPRRLLALVCRRGHVSREDVGAIQISDDSSTVEVAATLAENFELAVRRKDSRDPHVRFRRWDPSRGKRTARAS